MGKPRNAVGLVRLSDLRWSDLDEDGHGKGIVDQEQRIRDHAARLGWTVGRVIVENDLKSTDGKVRGASAFKRRKVKLADGRVELRTIRPGFRLCLDLLADGAHDGLLALDLDRTVRDPRDLEDLIDVVETHRVPVESVTGSLRMANDADITMARVMVAVANKESRDKARRVSAARQRQAEAGEYGGGTRPYGFDDDGVTVRWDEAAVIEECSRRLVQGASLNSIAADLRASDVPSVQGAPWTARTLRCVLLRPRNAGRMVYQGEEVGDAPWKPIVPVEMFRAVQRVLTDPSRRTGPGNTPRWLGSTLYRCGICEQRGPVIVRIGGRQPAYRCRAENHLVRAVRYVDALVVDTILGRLAQPDAIDLFTPARPDVDVAALRAEADAIRINLNELAQDRALGLIDRGQMLTATKAGNDRLTAIETLLRGAVVDSPVAPLIGADDLAAVWEALPLSHQRLIVDTLVDVTILPSSRRGRGFDPATVHIGWKTLQPAEEQ